MEDVGLNELYEAYSSVEDKQTLLEIIRSLKRDGRLAESDPCLCQTQLNKYP